MKSPFLQAALLLGLLLFGFIARHASAQTSPVTVNFNNFGPGAVVTDQYRPYVTFSANGFSAGGGYPTDVFTNWDGTYPGSILSTWHVNSQGANANVFVHFLTPVNNLSFKILGSIQTWQVINVDVYVGGFYHATYGFNGNGSPYFPAYSFPVTASFGPLSNITGIHIYNVWNGFCDNFRCYGGYLYYDDFTFTPDINVNITNPRVGGNLQGTVKKALLGADVRLQAAANRSGGTYSWSFTGGNRQHISTSADQTATLGRWTEPGTYKATVSYTLNGVTVSSSVDVEVIVPTLTVFTADIQDPDEIFIGDCARGFPVAAPTAYQLGCSDFEVERGIFFTATAQIPSGDYLSAPGQSGIKFKQGISTFRKRMNAGSVECYTRRTSDADVASGWQLDTSETYNHAAHPPVYFSQGSTQISMRDFDTPGTVLAGKNIVELVPFMYDAVYVDDRFEMYVYYFTGTEPDSPILQRPPQARELLPAGRPRRMELGRPGGFRFVGGRDQVQKTVLQYDTRYETPERDKCRGVASNELQG